MHPSVDSSQIVRISSAKILQSRGAGGKKISYMALEIAAMSTVKTGYKTGSSVIHNSGLICIEH